MLLDGGNVKERFVQAFIGTEIVWAILSPEFTRLWSAVNRPSAQLHFMSKAGIWNSGSVLLWAWIIVFERAHREWPALLMLAHQPIFFKCSDVSPVFFFRADWKGPWLWERGWFCRGTLGPPSVMNLMISYVYVQDDIHCFWMQWLIMQTFEIHGVFCRNARLVCIVYKKRITKTAC